MRLDEFGLPEHGGYLNYGDKKMLDFSANLNPLGMPENVREALKNSVGEWERYPDPDCTELVKRLSERLCVPAENIVCGNGADDLIYRIIAAVRPKHGLTAEPCFSEYRKAFGENGIPVTGLTLYEENGFAVHEKILNQAPSLRKGYMLALASPNNPTGRIISGDILRQICGDCERFGIFFLCDECFLDFCENAQSVRDFLNPYVISLSAFTKSYAMAGLRLGYAVFGDRSLAEKVRKRGQYWSVSAPAQIAGIAALEPGNYLENSRKLISEQRESLSKKISGLGIKVFGSDANFLLIKTEIPLCERLYEQGMIIRQCANFGFLDKRFYRIAVRTESENSALISALEKIFSENKNG